MPPNVIVPGVERWWGELTNHDREGIFAPALWGYSSVTTVNSFPLRHQGYVYTYRVSKTETGSWSAEGEMTAVTSTCSQHEAISQSDMTVPSSAASSPCSRTEQAIR
nr:SH2 domain-containing protein 1A isoform X3 [Anas platyrhynchos]